MRMFDRTETNRPFGKLCFKKGIYGVDFANFGNFVAYCGAGNQLGVVSYL